MGLTAVLEPLVLEPDQQLQPLPSGGGGGRRCSGERRHHRSPSLRTLTMGSDDSLTLNQASTGVPLFHDIRLFWGPAVGPHANPTPSSSSTTGATTMRLMLKNPPTTARVTVNDKQTCYGCRLRDGDVLSFKTMDGRSHVYKIRITDETNADGEQDAGLSTSRATAPLCDDDGNEALASSTSTSDAVPSRKRPMAGSDASSTEPPPPAPPAAPEGFAEAAEEFSCVVCMELQVQSTTLVPCGHSLCHSCAGEGHASASCPTCRSAVHQRIPNRLVDNAVAALVRCPGFFQPDDVAVYHARMQEELLHRAQQQQDPQRTGRTAASSASGTLSGGGGGVSRRAKRARRMIHHHRARTHNHHLPHIPLDGGATVDCPICIE